MKEFNEWYLAQDKGLSRIALAKKAYEEGQASDIRINEARYIIEQMNNIEPKNRDYDMWDRADAWLGEMEL